MPGQRRTNDDHVAIGVEVGGSQATIALVNRAGRVLQRCYAKILWNRPPTTTLEPCLRVVDDILSFARAERLCVHGLGFALPGSLDLTSRRPTIISALPALTGFPLADLLEARYKLPATLHVDVDAAALGEYYFGTGRSFRRLLFLSANAVVGASLVIDGQIEPAPQEYVGHICHLPVSSNGPRCSCGKRGCINTLVTLDALQRMLQRALRRGEETSLLRRLANRERFSLQLLAEETEAGDNVASQIYSEVSRWLGAATARYIDMFGPDALILGGFFSTSEALVSGIRRSLDSRSSSRVCSMVEISTATLGQDAPLLGAAVSHLS
ncbi:MAG TPA: ROK family protein [Ktedonobacteraceae bacterium]|nr:ROK family protein [Ktedonobacteraceae bacterium]